MEEEGGEQQQQQQQQQRRQQRSSSINDDDDDGSRNQPSKLSSSSTDVVVGVGVNEEVVSTIEQAIENLDCSISRFGDASFEPYTNSSSNNDDEDVDTTTASSSITNDIIKKYTPVGLEESFQQLFTTIQPCLVPTTTTTSSSRTTNTTTTTTMTASAIVMGPRGSGKTLLIERCLSACQELSTRLLQLQQHNNNSKDSDNTSSLTSQLLQHQHQRQYRKVYINGILIRGEDVQSVIFEIIRQLSDIALQEKKERRRIQRRIEKMEKEKEMDEKKNVNENDRKKNDDDDDYDTNENETMNQNNTKSRKRQKRRHVELENEQVEEEEGEELKQQQLSKRIMKSNDNDDDAKQNDENKKKKTVSNMEREEENDDDIDIDDIDTTTASNNDNYLLRVRQNSSFTSNLSLLETTLKISEIDQLPIILILDELDCFTDEGERQLLLYYLFDKVATPGSNLCLLATTTNFSTLSLLEKRIRSRAEGTSKIIYVKPPTISYDYLMKNIIIQSKLQNCFIQQDIMNYCCLLQQEHDQGQEEGDEVQRQDTNEHGNSSNIRITTTATTRRIIHDSLQRAFNLGKDIRWFGRVISCAL